MKDKQETGLRFNEGKIRYDLLPPRAVDEMAKVFTKGAEKYAPRNWEKGMDWTKVLASLKRHIAKFEQGEDVDSETGLLHMAHAMTNAAFLVEYYKIYPQGDDRQHHYLRKPAVALDVDGVLADFDGAYKKLKGIKGETKHWQFTYFDKSINSLGKKFWTGIPLTCDPNLPVEPIAYVTHRQIPVDWTREWIEKVGLPCAPVINVNGNKADELKKLGAEFFVDDSYSNFIDLNKSGIFTYLFDKPYNRKYNVGFRRIKSLSEIL